MTSESPPGTTLTKREELIIGVANFLTALIAVFDLAYLTGLMDLDLLLLVPVNIVAFAIGLMSFMIKRRVRKNLIKARDASVEATEEKTQAS